MVQMLLLLLSATFLSFIIVLLQTVIVRCHLLARELMLVLVLMLGFHRLLLLGDHGPVGVVRRDCPTRAAVWSYVVMTCATV